MHLPLRMAFELRNLALGKKRPADCVFVYPPRKSSFLTDLIVLQYVDVVLSVNYSEAKQCLSVMGMDYDGGDEDTEAAKKAAEQLQANRSHVTASGAE